MRPWVLPWAGYAQLSVLAQVMACGTVVIVIDVFLQPADILRAETLALASPKRVA